MFAVTGAAPPTETIRTPAVDGIWVFLFGDMLVFAMLFGTFLNERSTHVEEFRAARQALHSGIGLSNTFVLMTSSLMVVASLAALRSGARGVASAATLAALAGGALFVALKIFEYTQALSHGHTPSSGSFFLYYFALTGIHLFHVCIGMAVLGWMWRQTRRAMLSAQRMSYVEGGACFWHLVDLLWMVLFPLLYLVS